MTIFNILIVPGISSIPVIVVTWELVIGIVECVGCVWCVPPVEVLSIPFGFTFGNGVNVGIMVSSHGGSVWISSDSSSVWEASVSSGGVWVSSVAEMVVVKKIRICFSFCFTLGNYMPNSWNIGMGIWVVVSIWVSYVWDNSLLCFFVHLSDLMLLFGDLDRVSFLRYAFLGHSFGVMWVHIFHNRYD